METEPSNGRFRVYAFRLFAVHFGTTASAIIALNRSTKTRSRLELSQREISKPTTASGVLLESMKS